MRTRRFGATVTALVGGALLLSGCRDAGSVDKIEGEVAASSAAGVIDPVIDDCNVTAPPAFGAEVTAAMANSGLPCDAQLVAPFDLDGLQLGFDFNSWLTFVALNAPDDSGQPGWLGWQDMGSLMLPGGAAPPPFGEEVPPPAICKGGDPSMPVLKMISKTPVTPTAEIAGEPLNTGPLIDQNGRYARYQILVNEPMYNYIVANKLYSQAGQKAFAGPVEFPEGSVSKDTSGTVGAMVVKVAWKVLGAGDDASTFQTVTGFVYSPADGDTPATCKVEKLGLAGMHIVHKVASAPQWLWGTFEHVANVPDSAVTTGQFSFYNPSCGPRCKVNAQPPQPWQPSTEPFPNDFHSQIVRTTKYPPQAIRSASNWNPRFQKALAGSVLANYKMITTQWPTNAKDPADPNGDPFPLFVANSTMETYVQGNVPQASSSCMACHGNATDTAGKPSDFSFVLEKAF